MQNHFDSQFSIINRINRTNMITGIIHRFLQITKPDSSNDEWFVSPHHAYYYYTTTWLTEPHSPTDPVSSIKLVSWSRPVNWITKMNCFFQQCYILLSIYALNQSVFCITKLSYIIQIKGRLRSQGVNNLCLQWCETFLCTRIDYSQEMLIVPWNSNITDENATHLVNITNKNLQLIT